MFRKQVPARRGGIQSHGARSQDRISDDGARSQDMPVNEHATVSQHLPDPMPGHVHPSPHQLSTTPSLQQQPTEPSPPEQEQHTATSLSGTPHAEDVSTPHHLIEDPPSGGELPSAYWGPPDTPIVEDDLVDTELIDPVTKGKRGPNKTPKANKIRELRVNGKLDANELFDDEEENKVISHRMKYFFDPRFTSWEKVQKSHRQRLWNEFGMACRWAPEINEKIARQWNHMNGVKYRNMMGQAKSLADEGFRSDWMQVRHFWICKKYWDSPEFKKVSEQNQRNRGVEFDDAGNALKAIPTHTGGQHSVIKRGDTLNAYVETKKRASGRWEKGVRLRVTMNLQRGRPYPQMTT